jgi:hypothetical protein
LLVNIEGNGLLVDFIFNKAIIRWWTATIVKPGVNMDNELNLILVSPQPGLCAGGYVFVLNAKFPIEKRSNTAGSSSARIEQP